MQSLRQKKVLISSDRRAYSSKASAIFETLYGFETISASADGGKLCELAIYHRPDIVIWDTTMFRFDAIGVMEAIKSCNSVKIPLLFVIGTLDSSEYENELIANGAAYYFLIPLDVSYMAERCVKIFELSQQPFKPI